jgi:hypothetical protein
MSVSQVTPVIEKPESSTNGYAVIGTRPIRPDGTDKVTGRAQYGADVRLTGRGTRELREPEPRTAAEESPVATPVRPTRSTTASSVPHWSTTDNTPDHGLSVFPPMIEVSAAPCTGMHGQTTRYVRSRV